jgi:transcriptional regulator with XRE-family HTH domain
MKQLSEALRLMRVFHDVSQTELADRLGISKSFLSEIESGKKEPTLNLLSRYAAEFDVSLSSLLFFVESVSTKGAVVQSDRVAPKVLKLLNWISASREPESTPARKPAQRQLSPTHKRARSGS